MKTNLLFLILALVCRICVAVDDIQQQVSPKLKVFLSSHPDSLQILTNSYAESFANRTLQLCYFYSENEAIPRATHYYPDEQMVSMLIRENQKPIDEYICLLFEILNSESEKDFLALNAKAEAGTISKSDFVRQHDMVEFRASKKIRDLLKKIKFTNIEQVDSYYHDKFKDVPDDYESYAVYYKLVRSKFRDPQKEDEATYDRLRQHH